jgi:hypothetical protein
LSHKFEGTLKGDYRRIGHVEGDAMNQDAILAVLCDSRDDAKSLKEIAQEMGLDISTYVDWVRVERRLSSSLKSLTRWGWVAWEQGKELRATGSGITPTGRPSWQMGEAANKGMAARG